MNWLSILEASYIVYKLRPYYKNYKKRLTKRSKLYFYDSAIVCHLLGIDSPKHLESHSSRGAIFEGFVIGEFLKLQTAKKHKAQYYYWREHGGLEVDLLMEKGSNLGAVEIKSSMTLAEHFQKGLKQLIKTVNNDMNIRPAIIYTGEENLSLGDISVINWQSIANMNLVN